jgi:thiol:disulfide interchange protein DsbD
MSAFVSHDGVAPGGRLQLAVVYEVPANHHIQLNDFIYAELAADQPFQLGERRLPEPVIYDEEPVFTGKVVVKYDLGVADDAPLGERTLRFKAGYQACSEKPIYACYPPDERELAVPVKIVAAGTAVRPIHPAYFGSARPPEAGRPSPPIQPMGSEGATAPAAGEAAGGKGGAWLEQAPAAPGGTASELGVQEGLATKLRGALARGSWIAFAIVFLAGVLTSFTPCVYPMIPITIGYLVRTAGGGRFSGFLLSVFFVLGIAIIYSTLGLAAALSGGVFGAALQSTTATVLIAVVFAAMGASMLGAFDLSLPSSVQTKMQLGQRGGWLGAVLMGGVTGLVASPCVGPVLVVLLTWVAQVGRPFYGFTLLFAFAVGLGLLFLILGTFVGTLRSLPRAGQWMESVKHYFGWIFLALAVYYLRTKIGETATAMSYGVLLIVFATHVGAFSALAADAGKGARWRKGIAVVLAVWGIALLGSGLMTRYGWRGTGVVATGGPAGAGSAERIQWRSDEAAALAEARSSGKPILIDFTAAWCAACHELDEKTWVHAEVAQELARYVTIRLDMTDRNPETVALGSRWKVSGLPTVIVLDPEGNEVERFFGFRPAEQVLPLLRRVS